MAGGQNIDNVYIQTFENNVKHLAQQMNTKLRGTVMERATNGQLHNWEILDFSDAIEKQTSAPNTPDENLGWDRRRSTAETWHTGSVVDNEDIVQMLVEPKSNIAYNLTMSLNRAYDDMIIAAIGGDSTDGTGTPVPFPAGQKVGDGSADISFDAIGQIQEVFMSNDVDMGQPKYAVISPRQVRQLLNLTEQVSRDYVNAQALQTLNASGIVENWYGFTWIMSNRLLTNNAGADIDCLFYTPDAIGLQVNEDITVQVAQDPSASFAWRIYGRMTAGAVRVQDKKVVVGNFKQTD